MATMTLDELVGQLRAAFGDALRAVVLYGSAASGEHIAKRSDYNVLVLVDTLDLDVLTRESAIARAWVEAKNPPPLTLTVDEWLHSADVFPMEYADILERHKVLYGTPPFEGMRIEPMDLRRQVEHEAMGKLLRLRAGVLTAGTDKKRLLELLASSITTFMVIFRAVLRVHGERPPAEYEALCGRIGAVTGIDTAPFVQVVHHVRGRSSLSEQNVSATLAGYLAGAQALYAHIDQLTT
ncbi:MAG: nucleotidyltransferase domain-containing protein [Gemmatimonadota bacterium]|nr:nucleotidyltransferase domain-containing protein [Gemmatimonadota bacterium]